MKVDGAISSLLQGVSQQPDRERLPGQCELQENLSSDPVNGLLGRGPLEYVANLIDSSNDYEFEYYDAGSLGEYIIAYRSGEIRMFDLDGTELTVNNNASSYLPTTKLKFFGLDDRIYVLDPEKVTAMDAAVPQYVEDGVLIFLLGGQYGRKYEITLRWEDSGDFDETVSKTTPDGSTASHINDIATDEIAKDLVTNLQANANINADFDITRTSDVIYIKKKVASTVTDYSAEVSDGDGGQNMFVVNRSVKDVGDLPRYAPHNYIVEVNESGVAAEDNWYLEFIVDPDANGDFPALGEGFGQNGTWVEATAPQQEYIIDASTMPHVLTQDSLTEWTFDEGTWEDRAAGDDESNPGPSFIDNPITDIGAFQGRLVFLSTVNCIMSRSSKFTGFFNQSATTLADDDPIDIASSVGTFIFRKMVSHNRDLVIFSDSAQFVIFGRTNLTPKNSSLVLTTEFDADLSADPVSAGRNIFFLFKYGNFSGTQEFFTEGGEDVNDARAITSHVLQYIAGQGTHMATTTNFNKLLIQTDDSDRTVYVYEYIWQNRQKVQSSWSKWTFDKDVKRVFFVDNLIYVVTKEGDLYDLATIDLDITQEEDVGYRIMLDHKLEKTGVNTTFTIPYEIDDIDNFACVQGTGSPNPGMLVPIDNHSAGTVTLKNDMDGGTVYFGRKFMRRYIPTMPFVRDRDGVKVGGKLIIKQFTAHFDNTGYFVARITDDYGYEQDVIYNGRVLGNPDNKVGVPVIVDGSFDIPFKKNADFSNLEIRSDSHLPFALLEFEWNGDWRKKGRRITGG